MTKGIKKDDQVMVIAGKDRGHVGRVINVQPDKGRLMVDGAARAKRHERVGGKRAKGSGQQLQQGGIMDIELSIDMSNVQLVCPSCGKPTRIGHEGEGKERSRICRKCGASV